MALVRIASVVRRQLPRRLLPRPLAAPHRLARFVSTRPFSRFGPASFPATPLDPAGEEEISVGPCLGNRFGEHDDGVSDLLLTGFRHGRVPFPLPRAWLR